MKAITFFISLLFLAGCAATGTESPQQAATVAQKIFQGSGYKLLWLPSAQGYIANALASTVVMHAGLDSPAVSLVHQEIAAAREADVRIAISGADSGFAAKVTIAAMKNTSGMLPKLQLAFIGSSEDAELVRSAVEEKGGKFFHVLPNDA